MHPAFANEDVIAIFDHQRRWIDMVRGEGLHTFVSDIGRRPRFD